MSSYSTEIIEANLSDCDDIEQLKEKILPLLQDQRTAWSKKMEEILDKCPCKKLAQLCQVSETSVRKWRRGSLPQNRDMYLRIGFAAGYDLPAMNAFLKRYGKCPQLYAKSLEDSICIFILSSDTIAHTYAEYASLLAMVKNELRGAVDEEGEQDYAIPTSYLSEQIFSLANKEEMLKFARDNAAIFRQTYARLYTYVNAYLTINLGNEHSVENDGRKPSFHAMATASEWSSSLRHCISEIRNKRWFPLRHKVISLGLHLNMDVDAINQMLRYAQMEPLYAKSPIEAAIKWAVEEMKLSSAEDEIIQDGSSELCDFVKDILMQLDLSESEYLIDEL